MKDGMWCSHAAGPRIWWEVRHWWYNHVSGPVVSGLLRCLNRVYNECGAWWYHQSWYQSPLGRAVLAVRGWDDMVFHNKYLQGQADGYLREGNELRENRDLLREALQIVYELAPHQLELLLAEAEANMRKRNQSDCEPF